MNLMKILSIPIFTYFCMVFSVVYFPYSIFYQTGKLVARVNHTIGRDVPMSSSNNSSLKTVYNNKNDDFDSFHNEYSSSKKEFKKEFRSDYSTKDLNDKEGKSVPIVDQGITHLKCHPPLTYLPLPPSDGAQGWELGFFVSGCRSGVVRVWRLIQEMDEDGEEEREGISVGLQASLKVKCTCMSYEKYV